MILLSLPVGCELRNVVVLYTRSIFLGSSTYSLTLTKENEMGISTQDGNNDRIQHDERKKPPGPTITHKKELMKKTKQKTLTKERNSFSPIQQSMVICQRDDHDRSDDNFAVYDYGFVFDRVHA